MGSGKTTIGKLLAAKLKYKFVDLDSEIESAQGMEISQIFSKMGENSFREMERDTLALLIKKENQVLSVGGGLPCFQNNMKTMNVNGITIYLKMSAEAILTRLLQLPETSRLSRPLLANKTNDQLSEFIKATLQKRESFYNQANIVVLNETSEPNITMERIIAALSLQKKD
jgi:shikimate kinase